MTENGPQEPPFDECRAPERNGGDSRQDRDPAGRFAPGTTIGQPTQFKDGNTAALTHGLTSVRARAGLLPEQEAWRGSLPERRAQLHVDLGGRENLSLLEQDCIERLLETETLLRHGINRLITEGAFTGTGRIKSVVTHYYLPLLDRWLKLVNVVGLKRRAKPVETLEAYFARVEREKAALAAQDATGQAIDVPGDSQSVFEADAAAGPPARAGRPAGGPGPFLDDTREVW